MITNRPGTLRSYLVAKLFLRLLALFALNIEILLVDVTNPEKSKILTLTWPVTSSVASGSNFWPCTGSSRTRPSNGVWNLEIGPVVWEISGGPFAPPPSRTCCQPDPSGARVNLSTPLIFHFQEPITWYYKHLNVRSPKHHFPSKLVEKHGHSDYSKIPKFRGFCPRPLNPLLVQIHFFGIFRKCTSRRV